MRCAWLWRPGITMTTGVCLRCPRSVLMVTSTSPTIRSTTQMRGSKVVMASHLAIQWAWAVSARSLRHGADQHGFGSTDLPRHARSTGHGRRRPQCCRQHAAGYNGTTIVVPGQLGKPGRFHDGTDSTDYSSLQTADPQGSYANGGSIHPHVMRALAMAEDARRAHLATGGQILQRIYAGRPRFDDGGGAGGDGGGSGDGGSGSGDGGNGESWRRRRRHVRIRRWLRRRLRRA